MRAQITNSLQGDRGSGYPTLERHGSEQGAADGAFADPAAERLYLATSGRKAVPQRVAVGEGVAVAVGVRVGVGSV